MWDAADAYEQYMGRWSRAVAQELVDVVRLDVGARCLDLGCGVGSLSHVLWERSRPRTLVGVDRSAAFLRLASRQVPGLLAVQADATCLPLRTATFDAAVSGLVLNFVPDPQRALAEVARVVRPGGSVAAYVWDYDHPDFFLTRFWEGLAHVTGERASGDERGLWSLCTEQGLAALVASSPLRDGEVSPVVVTTAFGSMDELWEGFFLGVGPSGQAALALHDDQRARLRVWLEDRLPVADDGSVRLTARALTVVTTVR